MIHYVIVGPVNESKEDNLYWTNSMKKWVPFPDCQRFDSKIVFTLPLPSGSIGIQEVKRNKQRGKFYRLESTPS
jgi:hypothetical protein